jgi:hypothetical protein
MSDAQYESMKDAFEEEEAFERVGIYRSEDQYAIVVRLPKDNKPRLAGIGAGIGATGLVLGLAAGRGVTIRQKSKWIQSVDSLMKDAARFANLCAHLLSIRLPSADLLMKESLDVYVQQWNMMQTYLAWLEIDLPKVQNNEYDNHKFAKRIKKNVKNLLASVSSLCEYVQSISARGEVEPIAEELGGRVLKEIQDLESYSTWLD